MTSLHVLFVDDEQAILDGHNRHEICTRHDIPYTMVEISLPDLAAAQAWMVGNQLGRRNLTPEQARSFFREGGNESAHTGGRHPFMHRTESVDYAVVLEGEITMLLDEQDVVLKAGDIVIQRGTNHAWSNRSGKPVRMLYILIDGKFDQNLAAQFKKE